MPRDKFKNPLLQPSTEASTLTEMLPSTSTPTTTPRKRGKQAFEQTHERITLWLDKGLKTRFEALAQEQNKAKSTLLDEAVADLLLKYQA